MNKVTVAQLYKLHDEINNGRITREFLQAFLENPSGFTKENTLSSFAIAAKYGYTVVSDVEPSQFKVKDVKFITFFKKGESHINSETMRQRAITLKGNLGLVDGQYLLDHQEEIPEEMRGKYIVFPGTLLRYSGGDRYVAYLDGSGAQWVLRFDWLGSGWSGYGRVCVL